MSHSLSRSTTTFLVAPLCAAAISLGCSAPNDDAGRGVADGELDGQRAAVNPQPDPPSEYPGPALDVAGLTLAVEPPGMSSSGAPTPGSTLLGGGRGAVGANEAEVWLWDWLGTADAVTTEVRDDGSFGPVVWTDRAPGPVRLQARSTTGRGLPIDVLLGGTGTTPLTRALDDCVRLPLEIDVAATDRVRLDNICTESFTLFDVRLRIGSDHEVVTPTLPLVVAPGDSAEIIVEVVLDAGIPREDLLLLDLGLGVDATESWAVTLFSD